MKATYFYVTAWHREHRFPRKLKKWLKAHHFVLMGKRFASRELHPESSSGFVYNTYICSE